jgi:hypothetical protein
MIVILLYVKFFSLEAVLFNGGKNRKKNSEMYLVALQMSVLYLFGGGNVLSALVFMQFPKARTPLSYHVSF